MTESIPTSELLQRYEDVIRENERLRRRLGDLTPAIGNFAELVRLAKAVRLFRQDGNDEARDAMFAAVDTYDGARSGIPNDKPAAS